VETVELTEIQPEREKRQANNSDERSNLNAIRPVARFLRRGRPIFHESGIHTDLRTFLSLA